MQSNPSKTWTSASLAQELRNNLASCTHYLRRMEALGLVQSSGIGKDQFQYDDSKSGYNSVIGELADNYRVQRHIVYQLIYSPLKKARDFSGAFRLTDSGEKEDPDDR